jgi:hypothetical protein
MFRNLLSSGGFRNTLTKLGVSVALVFLIAITASPYTLVLRNGQRMEIPDEFVLTKTTLTYEISPGFNRTMLITLINIPATERANRESPGGFYKHAEAVAAPVVNQPVQRAVRTLTNTDLEAVRQRRVESEQAYEARRKQLGLPTVAETRRRQDEESALVRAEIREGNFAKMREESYWRGRARDLRNEIAAVDTQINYLRGRITELNQSSLAQQSFTEIYPLWPNNRPWLGNGQWGAYPNWNWRLPGYTPARPGYGGLGYPGYGYPPGPFDNFNNSQQRSELTYRMDDLLVRRAGLAARWRTLEDEARDARVPQVWLEP